MFHEALAACDGCCISFGVRHDHRSRGSRRVISKVYSLFRSLDLGRSEEELGQKRNDLAARSRTDDGSATTVGDLS
jgi:hypothetical protein